MRFASHGDKESLKVDHILWLEIFCEFTAVRIISTFLVMYG